MGKKRIFDSVVDCYAVGTYFLGVSAGVLINLLWNLPWQINLFYLIVMFLTGLVLISRSKRLSRELKDKLKKEKRGVRRKMKDDKKTKTR